MGVKDLNPGSKNFNVIVKCVKAAAAVEGDDSELKEAVCGDDTGVVTISLRTAEHAALCKAGSAIRAQNAHVRMIKGFIRLVVDKWSAFKAADAGTVDFEDVD